MKTRIVYSRKKEVYLLIPVDCKYLLAETIKAFPKGHKADAEVFQLQHETPHIAEAVAELVIEYLNLKGRAFRGGQILADGGVRPTGEEGRYLVTPQTNPHEPPYRVSLANQFCSCPDWENGRLGHQHGAPMVNNGRPMCKHIVAVRLFEQFISYPNQEGENHE